MENTIPGRRRKHQPKTHFQRQALRDARDFTQTAAQCLANMPCDGLVLVEAQAFWSTFQRVERLSRELHEDAESID